MGLKEKVKREIRYMKVGAKRLPSVMAHKAGQYVKGHAREWWETQKREARLARETKEIEKKVFAQEYEEEMRKQAVLRAQARAKAQAQLHGKGKSGLAKQAFQMGQRLDVGDLLGAKAPAQKKGKSGDTLGLGDLGTIGEPDYWGGLSKKKRKGK